MARYVGHPPPHPSSLPPQTLLLTLGEEKGRKSPLTSSSLAPKVGGRTLIGAPPFCFAGGGGGMCEGWKKKEEKESLFMGVSQKKFFLSLPLPCGRKHDKFHKIDES